MAEEIPVYLFTGFMDSGKTSLIKDTIFENDFANGSKGLIIMCEDGDVEYDMDKLKAANIQVAEIDSEDEFTAAKLNELNMQYLPEQVFIEYNGTWGIDKIIEAELPKGWVIVQSLATVDSTTFDLYMNNMRAMMHLRLRQLGRCRLGAFRADSEKAVPPQKAAPSAGAGGAFGALHSVIM